MAKIYWLTGQSGSGKSTLGKKLSEFLSTEKRNWRKNVFYIDSEYFITSGEILTKDEETLRVQYISEYVYKSGCDVVVSITAPKLEIRDEFKKKIGTDIEEFYIHSSKKIESTGVKLDVYEPPVSNFFDVDTTKDNPIQSFTKIVYYLNKNKLYQNCSL